MNICILLALVYIIGGVGILIMKKLQPEDKIYPVWVAAICVILAVIIAMKWTGSAWCLWALFIPAMIE